MTTNRMGLEQTLSDEQLEELITELELCGIYGRQVRALAELQEFRKASKKPFMFGIIDPDGEPHMDECCVSTKINGVEDWVAMLNDDVEVGEPLYKVMPLYAAPQLQAVKVPDGWIKCSEKMPEEEEQYYLTYSDGDGVCRSYFFDGYFADQHITHWMPLVLPPASVTNEP